MARIVLVMHAPLGSAFASCAQHVLGQSADLTVFDVQPNGKPDALVPELTHIMRQWPNDPILVLCDIYGATPFNVARHAADSCVARGLAVQLLTGTSLAMVLKAITAQDKDLGLLAESVRRAGARGIITAESGA
jgi:PTS system ascorbate-specific IIA component